MSAQSSARPARRLAVFVPLALFLLLTGVFLMQLLSGRDISAVPSALIGQPAPPTSLPPLPESGLPGFESAGLRGKVTLVNVFASWCAPCRQEHPLLMALSRDSRISIVGINYKDKPENARRFLGELGNPYGAIGVDGGRAAINWGVYGVPETFLIGKDGKILDRYVGPLNPESLRGRVMPAVEKALATSD